MSILEWTLSVSILATMCCVMRLNYLVRRLDVENYKRRIDIGNLALLMDNEVLKIQTRLIDLETKDGI